MALTSGTKLGPYEIQSPLGAGGMGEVYRAKDTRLDRTVAVKILPSHLSDNPEAKQRFDREARSVSSLNHPNICTLHDIGHQDGVDFLVMEYLEGESLEARLLRGPMPLKEALEVGGQICDALQKAHRAGIVHRDLKPSNIMLTASGAKLLDFGLAKPTAALLGGQPLSGGGTLTPSTPTMNISMLSAAPAALTQQGTIVGTFQYMAPEVLQGGEADARSDLFSFGCVLYEMISGRRAFEGKSQLSVLTAILEKEPEPITTVRSATPPALDYAIRECLAKNPEARWQNAADVARQLRWIAGSGSGAMPVPDKAPKPRWREWAGWAAFALVLLSALAWSLLRQSAPMPVLRSFIHPPADERFDFFGDYSGPPAIAPDGSAIAFCAKNQKERNTIRVQWLSGLEAKKLQGTDGASFPFWSPDGKYIAFFAEGKLKKISAEGGPATILADAPNARGGAWSRDNVIVYEPDYRDGLWRVGASGGNPQRLTNLEGGKHTTHRWPQFMPDGRHFIFFATSHSGTTEQGIYFGSLADGSYRRVIDSDSGAQYASGYLLYHQQSALLTQKFDPTTGVVSGDPIPVGNSVEYDVGTWHTSFAVSQNGLLVYEPGSKVPGVNLVWRDRSGKELGKVVNDQAAYSFLRFSPDGKRLALCVGDPKWDVWIYDLVRGARTRLTFGNGIHRNVSWSADGQRVIYEVLSGETVVSGTSLGTRAANGGGQEELLLTGAGSASRLPRSFQFPQWSPDGHYLAYLAQDGPSGSVWAMPVENLKKISGNRDAQAAAEKSAMLVVPPSTSQTRLSSVRLSPDGRWLAYTSTELGREEVYITAFPSGGGKWQVSQTGGTQPVWRGDSKEIFFIGLDGFLQTASVSAAGNEIMVDQARPLFQTTLSPYDVTPDGQRFIFATAPEGASIPLVLTTNWTAELKK